MVRPLTDSVLQMIPQATELYFRLILVVAPAGSGKTDTLREVQKRINVPLVNVNLELSLRMLEMTSRQRALFLPRILEEIVACQGADLVLLDNLELLFSKSLQQDPLRLLQGLSRQRTLVASWMGTFHRERLEYADPGHPEYRRYPAQDFLVVSPGSAA